MMRKLLAAAIALAAVSLVACSGSDDGSPAGDGSRTETGATPAPSAAATAPGADDTPTVDEMRDREDDLRATLQEFLDDFVAFRTDELYAHFSGDFQRRCPREDFNRIMAIAAAFIGDLGEVTLEIEEITYADGRALVKSRSGSESDVLSGDGSSSDYWTIEDGTWKLGEDDESPCELDGAFSPDEDDDATPYAGPGGSRSSPAALGDTVRSGDLEVRVLRANLSAADDVMARSEFIDAPRAGYRYVLIRVVARHAGTGESTVSVAATNFRLTGSRNVLYSTWDDKSSCSFFDGEISGELFAGGEVEGDICFQAPEDEEGLMLVLEPQFSFGDSADRRFIALE